MSDRLAPPLRRGITPYFPPLCLHLRQFTGELALLAGRPACAVGASGVIPSVKMATGL